MLSFTKSLNLFFLILLFAASQERMDAQMMVQATGQSVFTLPALSYEYEALEPYIDAETMMIHHSRHHQGYVDKLNAALENHKLKGKNLDVILEMVMENDEDMAVLNNAGGHYNHSMFWKIMTPGGGTQPSGGLEDAIIKKFGSFEEFSAKFIKAATGVFGSGWAWLSVDKNNELFISTTKNQDNPLMKNVVKMTGTPILCIDVWEHAYYLKYQNKRADYIANFMKAINWDIVSKNFDAVK